MRHPVCSVTALGLLLAPLPSGCGSDAAPASADAAVEDATPVEDGRGDATPAEDAAEDDDTNTVTDDAAQPEDAGAAEDAATASDTASTEDAATASDTDSTEDAATASDVTQEVPDPRLEGPWSVTREDLDVDGFDAALFVPTSSAPVPAVVLAPGFQLDGSAFAGTARHLASHGVAVLVPTFGDTLLSPISHATLAEGVSAMIDRLASDPRFDAARLGAGGHSRGGKVALLAATSDGRIRASFNLDPVDAVGPFSAPSPANPSVTPELMAALTIPLGLVGSSRGGETAFPGSPACAPTADNYAAYASAAPSAPFVAVPPESGHNDFADPLPPLLRLACKAGDDPAAVRTAARGWMTAFYRLHLVGDTAYASWLVAP
jgi:hypothetical protein